MGMTQVVMNRVSIVLVLVLMAGCSQQSDPTAVQTLTGAEYLLSTEPEDARPVAEICKSAKDADQVVVVGRIGGTKNPWIEGRAAFSIADTSLVSCNEGSCEGCETPWDYCCSPKETRIESILLVKFVDKDGQVVRKAAQEMFHLKELQTVVIQGRVKRDETGNVSIFAEGLFVRPSQDKP